MINALHRHVGLHKEGCRCHSCARHPIHSIQSSNHMQQSSSLSYSYANPLPALNRLSHLLSQYPVAHTCNYIPACPCPRATLLQLPNRHSHLPSRLLFTAALLVRCPLHPDLIRPPPTTLVHSQTCAVTLFERCDSFLRMYTSRSLYRHCQPDSRFDLWVSQPGPAIWYLWAVTAV